MFVKTIKDKAVGGESNDERKTVSYRNNRGRDGSFKGKDEKVYCG